MKQRIGLILAVAGAILLAEPNVDIKVLVQTVQELAVHYWPIGLILMGAMLITPRNKKKRSTR